MKLGPGHRHGPSADPFREDGGFPSKPQEKFPILTLEKIADDPVLEADPDGRPGILIANGRLQHCRTQGGGQARLAQDALGVSRGEQAG